MPPNSGTAIEWIRLLKASGKCGCTISSAPPMDSQSSSIRHRAAPARRRRRSCHSAVMHVNSSVAVRRELKQTSPLP